MLSSKWYVMFSTLIIFCALPFLVFAQDDEGDDDGWNRAASSTRGTTTGTAVPEPNTYLMIGTSLGVVYVVRHMLRKTES